jgi:hypothetical protein
MTIEVTDIATQELVTETSVGGDRIDVRLVGSGEGNAEGELSCYLDAVHRAALDARVPLVVVDLRAVEFISATCLRAFLQWVGEVQRTRGYLVRFVRDQRKAWQRRSAEAIAFCGGDCVRIE